MQKLIMICPLSSQPRIIKRASQLNKLVDLKVLGFKRAVYEENSFSNEIQYKSLGYIQDKNYFRRIFKLIKAFFTIRKYKSQDASFYALSIDCLILARLAGFKSGYYEIGDLRSCERPNSITSRLERFLIRGLKGVVLTSEYFYSEYFEKFGIEKHKFVVIENKLDESLANNRGLVPKILKSEKVKIGLVGLFRYEKPIKFIVDFVNENNDKYELVCYGDGPYKALIEENVNDSISYNGSFKVPGDLAKIYENIDLNFVVYDSQSKNVMLALPNKLFESMFFSRPLLVSKGTSLEKEVNRLGVGMAISCTNKTVFMDELNSLTIDDLLAFSDAASKVEENKLIDESREKLKILLNQNNLRIE